MANLKGLLRIALYTGLAIVFVDVAIQIVENVSFQQFQRPGRSAHNGLDKNDILQLPEGATLLQTFQNATVTDTQRSQLFELLRVFRDVVTSHNLTYFMYGGTLIGSWRHHDLIPWDDDVDLIMDSRDRTNLAVAMRKLPPRYKLYYKFQAKRWKLFIADNPPINKLNWSYPFIDISFFRKKGNEIFDHDNNFSKKYRYPINLIFPLVPRPFGNLTLLAPYASNAVLQKNYDLTQCVTTKWNHRTENKISKQIGVPCSKLYNHFPFVFRKNDDKGEKQEILRIGKKDMDIFYSSL